MLSRINHLKCKNQRGWIRQRSYHHWPCSLIYIMDCLFVPNRKQPHKGTSVSGYKTILLCVARIFLCVRPVDMALCAKHSTGSNFGHSSFTAVLSSVESKNPLALCLKGWKKLLASIRKQRFYLTLCLLLFRLCIYKHAFPTDCIGH